MRAFAAAVVVASTLALTAGCTGGSPDPDDGISLGKQAAWSSPRLGLRSVTGVTVPDGTAVVAGYAGSGQRLAAVDTGGVVRWTADAGDPLPGGEGARVADRMEGFTGPSGDPVVVRDGDGWAVIVEYTRSRTTRKSHAEERGLAAVSGRDGSVRWLSPPLVTTPGTVEDGAAVDGDRTREIHLGAAGGDVVTASVTPLEEGWPEDLRTYAVSASDGHELWDEAGVWPTAVAGDVVLGQVPPDGDPLRGPPSRDGNVAGSNLVAFDAETGKRSWTLEKRFATSGLRAAAGDLAVVDVESTEEGADGLDDRTIVVAAGTGRTVIDFKTLASCDDDGTTMIACSVVGRPQLATIRAADRKVRYSEQNVTGEDSSTSWSVTGVWKGRIYVSIENAYVVVDREARRIGRELPGRPAAISDRQAVFVTPGPDSSGESYVGYEVVR